MLEPQSAAMGCALRVRGTLGILLALLTLASCGGGSADNSPQPPVATQPPPVTAADAARLLDQATFGATASDIAHVQAIGIDAYISEQIAYPPTQFSGFKYTPHTAPANCKNDGSSPPDAAALCARDQYSAFQVQRMFYQNALKNPDQLRQRVAFALSQIMVVSSVEIYEAYGLADYQNILLNDALGNYRTLLQDVTLSPTMGHYLDMAGSSATDPTTGSIPNQNYAREVLQLFSVGLVALNQDGTQQVDSSGAPIPTFNGDVINGFSSVFTGWTYPPLPGHAPSWPTAINFDGTMISFPDHHQTGTKLLLNGEITPASQTPEEDLANALDNIFNHPNVGPFISLRLIQHLVTSNPSPAYVARIAAVFANNGKGVRGDLSAVVRAILEDPEARGDGPATPLLGHLREPALFVSGIIRSLGGQSDGVLLRSASSAMGQPVYAPETVFSFYPPSYQIPGTQTLGPEFGIYNAATALAAANYVNTLIIQGGAAPDPTVSGSTGTSVDLTPFTGAANDSALVTQLNQKLMHGSLSSAASNIIVTAADAAAVPSDALAAPRSATYLILTSAQYQVEH